MNSKLIHNMTDNASYFIAGAACVSLLKLIHHHTAFDMKLMIMPFVGLVVSLVLLRAMTKDTDEDIADISALYGIALCAVSALLLFSSASLVFSSLLIMGITMTVIGIMNLSEIEKLNTAI